MLLMLEIGVLILRLKMAWFPPQKKKKNFLKSVANSLCNPLKEYFKLIFVVLHSFSKPIVLWHQELLNPINVKSTQRSMQVCTKKSKFNPPKNVSFIPFLSQWVPHKQSLTWMYHWFHIPPSKLKETTGLCVNPQTCVQPRLCQADTSSSLCKLPRLFTQQDLSPFIRWTAGQSVCWQPCDSIQMEIRRKSGSVC